MVGYRKKKIMQKEISKMMKEKKKLEEQRVSAPNTLNVLKPYSSDDDSDDLRDIIDNHVDTIKQFMVRKDHWEYEMEVEMKWR